jgi:hypothetical protein
MKSRRDVVEPRSRDERRLRDHLFLLRRDAETRSLRVAGATIV